MDIHICMCVFKGVHIHTCMDTFAFVFDHVFVFIYMHRHNLSLCVIPTCRDGIRIEREGKVEGGITDIHVLSTDEERKWIS